jgi:outer membrane assembly lipoprotein YfiO
MRRITPLFLVTLGACSAGFQPQDYPTPQALMEASEDLFRLGKWTDAGAGFEQVTFQLPTRDSVALRARFMLAETEFARGNYLEAARRFRRVVDESPTNPIAPNALLRAADAQAALWKRPELDPTYGEAALATYRELVVRYPGTRASVRAAPKMKRLAAMQAAKVFTNGEFYFKIGAYDSAILYYKDVVAQYGDTDPAVRALFRLVTIYQRLSYQEERGEMCSHLRTYYADAEGLSEACPEPSIP